MSLKKLWYVAIPIKVFVIFFMIGCETDTVEKLLPMNDADAITIYDTRLKSILDSKCINCHNFHKEGSNRYDNFEKTKNAIDKILKRISADSDTSMPPDKSTQLTLQEKLVFHNFFHSLSTNMEPSLKEKEIKLTFTAYKYPIMNERVGVSGTFTDINYTLNKDYTKPVDMLKDAYARITTNSVNIDGEEGMKTSNIKKHFFAFFSSTIEGQVISYNETNAIIAFTMNDLTFNVSFDVAIDYDKIVLKGTINDMNLFEWEDSYNKLEAVCGEFHLNKIWPDVDIELEVSF